MKRPTSFYISAEISYLMRFLMNRDGINKTTFIETAIQSFLAGNHYVDERVLITKRSHPQYIKRRNNVSVHIEAKQLEELETIAEDVKAEIKEKGLTGMDCNVSQLLFWSVLRYCAEILEKNSDGVEIGQKEAEE